MTKIKLPTKAKIKKAIEAFEDVQQTKYTSSFGIIITNISYDKNDLDDEGDMDISYTGKLEFDDHSETWHDLHVRYETLKKYL